MNDKINWSQAPSTLLHMGVILGVWLAGLLLALFVPENILDYPAAAAFVSFMSFIPRVHEVGAASSLPEVAMFHSAAMWAFGVPVVTGVWVIPNLTIKKEIRWGERAGLLHTIVMVAFVLAMAYIVLWQNLHLWGSTRAISVQIHTRAGIGLMGSMVILFSPLALWFLTGAVKHPKVFFYKPAKR